MIRKAVVMILVFFGLFGLVFSASAQEEAAPKLDVQVDHVASGVEKIKEKLTLLTKFSKISKADYHQYLAKKRLAELIYIIESGDVNSIEEVSGRYSAYLGRLNQHAINNKLTDRKDQLLNMYDEHKRIVDNLQSNFEYDSGFWLALQWSEDTTDMLSSELQKI